MRWLTLLFVVLQCLSPLSQAFFHVKPIHHDSRPLTRPAPRLFVSLSSPGSNSYANGGGASSSSSTTTATAASVVVNWDWQKVADGVFEQDKRPVILFDGLCNLCNGGVNFALDHDPDGNFRFASLQSTIGRSLLLAAGRNPNDIDSIVLCRSTKTYCFGSDAILQIAQGLQGSLPQLVGAVGPWLPRPVRTWAVTQVSEHRHMFGASDSCRMDWDGEFDSRFISEPEGLEGV